MWSFTCWRKGEVERDPEKRAGRALQELEGWPEEVRKRVNQNPSPGPLSCIEITAEIDALGMTSRHSRVVLIGTFSLLVFRSVPICPIRSCEMS